MKNKFTSRKFLVCIAGIFTGIGVALSGSTVEGIATVLTSVIAYLVAEGYVDAKAINAADAVVDEIRNRLQEN